jgi:arylsulfatase A-like enzyme
MASLGERGIRFSRAYSSACLTAHSIPAIMTGKFGGQLVLDYVRIGEDLRVDTHSEERILDRRRLGLAPVNDRSPTLAEVLSQRGYQTAAVIGYALMVKSAGITRGFEIVDDTLLRGKRAPGDEVSSPAFTARAVELLRQRDPNRPFFLWLHYLDPHMPYLGTPVGGVDSEYARYLGEIETVDRSLGDLLAAFEEQGLAQDTLMVFTSDHGEAFDEHGGEIHGRRLYEENIRVPLVVVPPRRAGLPPRLIDVAVRGVDVAPTIADLVGAPFLSDLAGRSLAPTILHGEAPPTLPVLVECFRLGGESRSLLRWPLKIIDSERAGVMELYDLSADPAERRNLVGERPAEAASMMGLLRGAESLLTLRPLPRPHTQP